MGSSHSPSEMETVLGTVVVSVQLDVPEHYTDDEIKQALNENYTDGAIIGTKIEAR